MGGCASKEDGEDAKSNAQIQKILKQRSDESHEMLKVLLLGAGESGKSTIFKQMKILFGKHAMTQTERNAFKQTIHNNILTTIQTILDYVELFDHGDLVLPENRAAFDTIFEADDGAPLTPELGVMIQQLWTDPAVVKVWGRRSEIQVCESLEYYFDHIARVTNPCYMDKDDYTPEELAAYRQDALLSRARTAGLVIEQHTIDGRKFELIDVGGQRNERRKWIDCFDNVTAVIFVAAISEYDQKLFEDKSTNRMLEAVQLFDEVINDKHFFKVAMILFLNKRDLFEKKIKRVDIADTPAFADYQGGSDYKLGCQYLSNLFLCKVPDGHRCYHHVTCATDSENIRVVFDSCKDVIISNNMTANGLLRKPEAARGACDSAADLDGRSS